MRNIRLFDEYSDFLAIQEALSGSGKYVEDIFPGFVYTRDKYSGDTYAYYNGHEIEDSDYHFGDVVYDDGTGVLKKVYWSEYTPSMGQKVGLIVVPTSHAADGNARMIAFENAINPNPEPEEQTIGSSNPKAGNELLLGANNPEDYIFPCIGMDNYGMHADGVLCWDIPGEDNGGNGVKAGNGTESNYIYYIPDELTASLSSDMTPTTGSGVILNPMSPNERYLVSGGGGPRTAAAKPETKDGETLLGTGTMDFSGQYYDDGIYLSVSPYLEDGTQNPNYVEPEWAYNDVVSVTPPYESVEPATRGGDALLGDPVPVVTAINAFADWNGYGNTAALADDGEYSSVAALDYSCVGTNKGDWYVGAMGEMGYVSSRMWAIRYIMNQLGGDDLLVMAGGLGTCIFTSSVGNYNDNYRMLQLGVRTLLLDGGGDLLSPSPTEEYPGEIPSVPSTSAFMVMLAYNEDASVRPMAMIKEGQIQHGEVPNIPIIHDS